MTAATVEHTMEEARPQAPREAVPYHEWAFPGMDPRASFFRTATGYLVRFPRLADFEVSANGQRVSCRPVPGTPPETLRDLERNQVVPLALSRTGKLVFHASAVELEEDGIAFVGVSGRGKSTLVASFATNGLRFLADDGLVVEERNGGFDVLPAEPFVRLWRDSEEALVGSDGPAAGAGATAKARLAAGGRLAFCAEPRPLRRLYFLGEGAADDVVLEEMKGGDALVELVKHSFLLDVDDRQAVACHFKQLTRLLQGSAFCRLDYPRRFESLPLVREAILRRCSARSRARLDEARTGA